MIYYLTSGQYRGNFMIISALNYRLFNVDQYLREFGLKNRYDKFMVDIETTGKKPDLNHIVEISIVPFSMIPNVIEVAPLEYHLKFKLNDQQLHRNYCAETMVWWGKQSKETANSVFSEFYNTEINNRDVLEQLAIFVARLTTGNTQFWSKPNSFDFMFLQSIYDDFKLIFPFRYYLAKDMAGFCSGLSFAYQKNLDYKIFKPLKREKVHDSMGDCYFQLEWMENAILNKPTDPDSNLPF